jgi:hypothetical protein
MPRNPAKLRRTEPTVGTSARCAPSRSPKSVVVRTMLAASANARWMSWRRSVHGDAVGVGGFADRLEEGGATGRAVSAASGGES